MLTGTRPRDRYDQLMVRATHAHRKPAPKPYNETVKSESSRQAIEKESRTFFSFLANMLGRKPR